jgi:hypothetical protein
LIFDLPFRHSRAGGNPGYFSTQERTNLDARIRGHDGLYFELMASNFERLRTLKLI